MGSTSQCFIYKHKLTYALKEATDLRKCCHKSKTKDYHTAQMTEECLF